MSSPALELLTLVSAFDLHHGVSDADRCIPGSADEELLLDLDDERLSFTSRQLAEAVHVTAGCVLGAARDIGRSNAAGMRVCVVLPNCAEYVTVYLGVASVSAVNCLLNPKFKEEEFKFAMKDMGCEMVLLQGGERSAQLTDAENAAKELQLPIYYVQWTFESNGRPTPRFSRQRLGDGDAVSPAELSQVVEAAKNVKGSDLALLLHTSGTTAAPKTVPITQTNNVATLHNIGQTYKWSPESRDCGLLIMPLFHVHGLFAGCLSPLSRGCRIVLARGGGFHKTTFWADAAKAQCTWVTAVPTMWQILLNTADETLKPHRKPEDNSLPVKLRFIRGCSSALPAPVAQQLEQLLDTEVLEAYAMSEATHQMCSNPLRGADGKQTRQFGSVGLPQGIDVAIIDPESGKIVKRGQSGEICVRGYNVITGYLGLTGQDQQKHFWNAPSLDGEGAVEEEYSFISNTPQLDNDSRDFKGIMAQYRNIAVPLPYRFRMSESPINDRPFLRTGDVGVMDADTGFVSLVGRSKELINRGGEKISPLEIDAAFLKFDEVNEAGAFGVPDAMLGEVVYLAVVLKDNVTPSAELFAGLRTKAQQSLARFKIPIKIYACPELPKGNTGKILRRELWNYVQKHPELQAY